MLGLNTCEVTWIWGSTSEKGITLTALGSQNTGYHSDSKGMEMKRMTDVFFLLCPSSFLCYDNLGERFDCSSSDILLLAWFRDYQFANSLGSRESEPYWRDPC